MNLNTTKFNEITCLFTPEQVGVFINILVFIHDNGHISLKRLYSMCHDHQCVFKQFSEDTNGTYYSELTEHPEHLKVAYRIINTVYKHYGIDTALSKIKDRHPKMVLPRQVSYYFIKKYTKLTNAQTALLFGQDHSTTNHAKKAVMNRIDTEPIFRHEIESIKLLLVA